MKWDIVRKKDNLKIGDIEAPTRQKAKKPFLFDIAKKKGIENPFFLLKDFDKEYKVVQSRGPLLDLSQLLKKGGN